MNTTAEIKLWGTSIGAVTVRDGQKTASFQYNPEFIKTGIQVSPIVMPLRSGAYSFPSLNYESFHGLPGLLSDSLPDRFGNELINAWLSRNGRLPDSFNAVERLCYTGTRGMGALEFFPVLGQEKDVSQQIHVQTLVDLASIVLQNRNDLRAVLDECDRQNLSKELSKIIRLGTSAGGARAKAVIAYNPATKEVRSGQLENGSGFENWLIKFSGVHGNKDKENEDEPDFGLIEYAYYLMAQKCGINMSPCTLLDDGRNRHFMTRRFDRTPDGKLHMQSLAGIAHFDFNQAGAYSYEQAFSVMNALGLYHPDKLDLFRRMIFNVMARNCDDHVKNISFLMDKSGKWKLSPAYDVCFAYNPAGYWTGSHQMTINGRRDGFSKEDFTECAKIAGLKKAEIHQAFVQVQEGISSWMDLAGTVGVNEKKAKAIQSLFERI